MFDFLNPLIKTTKAYCDFVQEGSQGPLKDIGGWSLLLKVKYLDSVFHSLRNAGHVQYQNKERNEKGERFPSYHPILTKEVLDDSYSEILDYINKYGLEEISIIEVTQFIVHYGIQKLYGEIAYEKNKEQIITAIKKYPWLGVKKPSIYN
ncbi:MAG: hypothetical protein HHAS10_04490 [Candidatus Altimarinota bacterium]